MSDQLALFGDEPPPKSAAKKHQFFYAAKPSHEATASIVDLRTRVTKELGLAGTGVAGVRLHITLHPLPHYDVYPDHRIELFCRIGSAIKQKPFPVTFDLVRSYASLVLVPSVQSQPLIELEQALAAFLADAGFHGRWSFSPHITLHYAKQKIPDRNVDPISWVVNEFVLIHSVHGETTHNLIKRFPLRG